MSVSEESLIVWPEKGGLCHSEIKPFPVSNKRLCIDSEDVSVPLPQPRDTLILQIVNLEC